MALHEQRGFKAVAVSNGVSSASTARIASIVLRPNQRERKQKMTTTKEQMMTTGIKMLRGAAFLFAFTVLLNSTSSAQTSRTHPDGPATTYRGWGPTVLIADGYECTLFDTMGVRVGSAAFHRDGRIDLTVATEQAHFQMTPVGLTTLHPIDVASFPSIPAQFRNERYQLLVFAGRGVVGANLFVNAPVTEFAESISVVEARCVYIIDQAGNVVYCLNCMYVIS
jgi:hypothetical protein